MFPAFAILLALSFPITLVNSASSLVDEGSIFDSENIFNSGDALSANMIVDDTPNTDYLTVNAESTNLFDLNPTLGSDPTWDQDILFAENTDIDGSCHAEDVSSLPVLGRLRARSAGGACKASGSSGDNLNEELTPFIQQLQKLEDLDSDQIKPRREICPAEIYRERAIPLCSSGVRSDEEITQNIGLVLRHAQVFISISCFALGEPHCCNIVVVDERCGVPNMELIGYDCQKMIFPIVFP